MPHKKHKKWTKEDIDFLEKRLKDLKKCMDGIEELRAYFTAIGKGPGTQTWDSMEKERKESYKESYKKHQESYEESYKEYREYNEYKDNLDNCYVFFILVISISLGFLLPCFIISIINSTAGLYGLYGLICLAVFSFIALTGGNGTFNWFLSPLKNYIWTIIDYLDKIFRPYHNSIANCVYNTITFILECLESFIGLTHKIVTTTIRQFIFCFNFFARCFSHETGGFAKGTEPFPTTTENLGSNVSNATAMASAQSSADNDGSNLPAPPISLSFHSRPKSSTPVPVNSVSTTNEPPILNNHKFHAKVR